MHTINCQKSQTTQKANRIVINKSARFARNKEEVLGKVKHIASTLISPGTKRALKKMTYFMINTNILTSNSSNMLKRASRITVLQC